MPEFYTLVILLLNQSEEIGENQLSDFGSKGGQISALMHVPRLMCYDKHAVSKHYFTTRFGTVGHLTNDI